VRQLLTLPSRQGEGVNLGTKNEWPCLAGVRLSLIYELHHADTRPLVLLRIGRPSELLLFQRRAGGNLFVEGPKREMTEEDGTKIAPTPEKYKVGGMKGKKKVLQCHEIPGSKPGLVAGQDKGRLEHEGGGDFFGGGGG